MQKDDFKQFFQDQFKALNQGVHRQQEDDATRITSEMMIDGAPLINFQLVAKLFRGRPLEIKDTPFVSIAEISARAPETVTDHQRCNAPGRSILYASNNLSTVFSELNAQKGQQIQVLEFESRPSLSVQALWIGAVDHYRRHGEFPRLMRPQTQNALQGLTTRGGAVSTSQREYEMLLDAFLSHVFRAEELQKSIYSIYKLTSILAEVFFDNAPTLEAIMYPSVGHLGGWNIAIKPDLLDQKFNVLSIEVHQVEEDLGYGIYRTKRQARAKSIENGMIGW